MLRMLWIGLAVAAMSGCPSKNPSGPGTPPNPGPGFDERQACAVDSDCAVVEIECCDHCNGGTAVGVHRDSADEITAQYRPEAKCKGAVCTEMACMPAQAICRQQRCGVSINGAETLTPLPRP